jgi:hypothetical protein
VGKRTRAGVSAENASLPASRARKTKAAQPETQGLDGLNASKPAY